MTQKWKKQRSLTLNTYKAMIQYTIAKRKMINDPSVEKYYPKIVRGNTLDTEKIALLLQERTTLEPGEIYGFLTALSKAIRNYVTDSYVVDIEGLGIFSPTISARAVNTPDELDATTIRKKGVNYRPTSRMKSKFGQIKFSKANLDTAHL